jgi:hypothetical protein
VAGRGRAWLVARLALGAGGAAAFLLGCGRGAAPDRPPIPTRPEQVRQLLFEALQPVALASCGAERFGELHDGGYLLCGNLLPGAEAAYSYGISGYDGWGCDVSARLGVSVHQYDCFDTRRPACPRGRPVFHEECVGGTKRVEEGRPFDTVGAQVARNGDAAKRLVVKMDVEGAEWDALLQLPDGVLKQIDQLAIEFHGVDEERFLLAVYKLRAIFHVAHLHFNNNSCSAGLAPFPAWAYEVLLVNKRLTSADPGRRPAGFPALDRPNNPQIPDCQT